MGIVKCTLWENTDVKWKDANWKWIECQLVQEIIGDLRPGIPGELAQPPWLQEEHPYSPYDKERRKRFIRLICKVKHGPSYNEEKEVDGNIKITIDDIRMVTKAVRGIDIEITK